MEAIVEEDMEEALATDMEALHLTADLLMAEEGEEALMAKAREEGAMTSVLRWPR
jgi:hypothetical protein